MPLDSTSVRQTRVRAAELLIGDPRFGARESDVGPIRGELFGPDRLAEHARQLAARQRVAKPEVVRLPIGDRGPLLVRLADSERVIAQVRDGLLAATQRGVDPSPAGGWLLDNYFVVQEHVREIRANMPRSYYHELPKLAGAGPFVGLPRVYEIAVELIAHTDGRLDLQNVDLVLREYQRVTPLKLGELWAMPVMLRMGLLENIRRMALRTARDLDDVDEADRWVARFRDAMGTDPSDGVAPADREAALARELQAFVRRPPELTPAFLTRFLQQIRSRRTDFTPLLWLEQWIAEDAMSVEQAVQRSTQRLALTQLVMANSITSLRTVAAFDWRTFVETQSAMEAMLRTDPAALYASMTFVTRDRYRHVVEAIAKRTERPEPAVAAAAVAAARESNGGDARLAHVGYWLVDDGREALERTLGYRPTVGERVRRWVTAHAGATYAALIGVTLAAALALLLLPLPDDASWWALVAALLLALVPASEIAIAVTHQLVTTLVPPRPLSRMDYRAGVPADDRTMVVVPILFSSVDAVHDALAHLEAQYLANRDHEIRFALLSDVPDAPAETQPDDRAIVDAALEGIRALNAMHATDGAGVFYLFHRPRRWNPGERAWMGWERKRGKLGEFNAYLRGRARDAFSVTEGDLAWLRGVRFVITLDSDTVLPSGAAAALVGTMAHPLNEPAYDAARGRVVRGYGILQPRVSVSLQSANRSRFAQIFADHPGVDPYTTAVSDVYQDLFGEGTFTGKGIYDVDAFETATRGRFPENTLLSHDLIEGAFARAGLVTDVEVFDDYPTHYLAATRRQHRWMRGDWQLLPWLRGRVAGPNGPTRNPLSGISRWKIIENLRRTLVPISLVSWLLAGWTVLPGSGRAWSAAALAALASPWLVSLLAAVVRPPKEQSWGPYYAAVAGDAERAFERYLLALLFLPHQALVATDAILRTLWRMLVTRRHLLAWKTASLVEQNTGRTRAPAWSQMWPASAATLLLLAIVAAAHSPGTVESTGALVLLGAAWLAAPEIAYLLGRPLPRRDLALTEPERAAALRYARAHWAFFEKFAMAETSWLAPDNFQELPEPVVAMRTSPTNMGLQLLAVVSALDLGMIDLRGALERLERALDTMERLPRYEGHFYNWYSLEDLRVLDPPYVSAVDSGNLAGHLLALAEACAEIRERTGGDAPAPPDCERLEAIARRARALAMGMDFRLVFDAQRKLLAIGYDVRAGRLDSSSYDLLASEARLASFVAIAKGDLPPEHWFRLGRTLSTAAGATALVSWSGSMFEYLMPLLVMPSRPDSLLDQSHRAAVVRQIAYGRLRAVPWGVSESAYNVRDRHGTYQYRGFGVPDLALKRGLARDVVVAPYAAALALLVDPHAALTNLALLERQGALGEYGFREAIDYTRRAQDGTPSLVGAYMAHHVGMSLVALDNALQTRDGVGVWQRRFMRDPEARAFSLLLDERVPRRYVAQPPQSDAPDETPHDYRVRPEPVVRLLTTPNTAEPRVGLLGGQPYSVLVTSAGGGYSRADTMAVTRWRADATRDDTGQWIYVKDVSSGRVWSSAYQPTGATPDAYAVTFANDRVELERADGELETHTEIVVVPLDCAEVRRVTVTNHSRTAREVELTSYAEIVLTTPDTERAHPAFHNLFVETAWEPSCGAVLASRRPRSSTEARKWLAHVVATGEELVGAPTCETDRARFVGRGRTTRSPRALADDGALSGTVGAVLDPIAAIRVRVRIEPGRAACVAFTTLVADDREHALHMVDQYHHPAAAERALALAGTEAQVELRDLDVSPAAAAVFQELAGALIYPHEDLRAPIYDRAENRRGQRALWAHGISGDWPIVLGVIDNEAGLSSVQELLTAHKYWRMKGVASDLVILNTKGATYLQELHDHIMSMALSSSEGGLLDRPGGVFVRRSDLMPAEDVALLMAVARIHIVCDGIGLGEVAEPIMTDLGGRDRDRERRGARDVEGNGKKPAPAAPAPRDRRPAIRLGSATAAPVAGTSNGIGRLADDGAYEMRITAATVPPAPWANVIANPDAGVCVTERGGGFAWVENSYFYRLTPWYNDPVSDPCGEVLYLRDARTGAVWTPTPGPALAPDAEYVVRHAAGASTFAHERDGIATELTIAVPESGPVKIARLRVTNRGTAMRELTLTSYVEWALGVQREHTRHQIHTRLDSATGAILAQNFFADDFASRVAFSWMSERTTSFTANREEFIGRNGDLAAPQGMTEETLGGATGGGWDPCAALRCAITLAPNETRDVVVLLGAAEGDDAVRALIAQHGSPEAAAAAIDGSRRAWEARLSTITVRTPSPELDAMVNHWALYQALACRMWARSALYQSSGAYGFRDQLQDTMAFVYAEPALARAHLLRAAAHQFKEGDVQHWWHEPWGRGVRTKFSDDLAWLPFVADHYVRVTGDTGVWDERAPYLEMRELGPDEHEVYEQPKVSEETGTLYEHCVRALDRACTTGQHGLPLMGIGDWNDGMNRVGVDGKGESVWLAWFLAATLRRFAEHAEARRDAAVTTRLRQHADAYAAAAEKEAWDGAWYRRAYYDDGTPLGSTQSDECRIDAIAQSWSVISGAGDAERSRTAMRSAVEHLVREDARLIMLLTPPFDKGTHDPGYIKGYVPGVRENGAQYTHAALWTVLAQLRLGDGDAAFAHFDMLNPLTHSRTARDVETYKVEPYVIAADVYTAPGSLGRGGWTWYTGSASWFYRVALEGVLGFTKHGDRLTIDPCVPRAWRELAIEYRHGTSTYAIAIANPNGVSRGVARVELDGRVLEDGAIALADDGQRHEVRVTLGAR